MTLEKAIEAMGKERDNIPVIPHSELRRAHLLGIEALKRLNLARSYGDKHTLKRLIGEDQ